MAAACGLIFAASGEAAATHDAGESSGALAAVPGVPVLMHAVACAPDLLHCQDIDTGELVFGDMTDCRLDIPVVRLEAAVAAPPGTVVFARCRYAPGIARRSTVEAWPDTGETGGAGGARGDASFHPPASGVEVGQRRRLYARESLHPPLLDPGR